MWDSDVFLWVNINEERDSITKSISTIFNFSLQQFHGLFEYFFD